MKIHASITFFWERVDKTCFFYVKSTVTYTVHEQISSRPVVFKFWGRGQLENKSKMSEEGMKMIKEKKLGNTVIYFQSASSQEMSQCFTLLPTEGDLFPFYF